MMYARPTVACSRTNLPWRPQADSARYTAPPADLPGRRRQMGADIASGGERWPNRYDQQADSLCRGFPPVVRFVRRSFRDSLGRQAARGGGFDAGMAPPLAQPPVTSQHCEGSGRQRRAACCALRLRPTSSARLVGATHLARIGYYTPCRRGRDAREPPPFRPRSVHACAGRAGV